MGFCWVMFMYPSNQAVKPQKLQPAKSNKYRLRICHIICISKRDFVFWAFWQTHMSQILIYCKSPCDQLIWPWLLAGHINFELYQLVSHLTILILLYIGQVLVFLYCLCATHDTFSISITSQFLKHFLINCN